MAAAAAGLIAEWGFGDVFDGGVRGGVCGVGAGLQERGFGPWRSQVSSKSAVSFELGRALEHKPKILATTGLARAGLPDLLFQAFPY